MATSDSFDRANEDPLASPWASFGGGITTCKLVSNVATGRAGTGLDCISLYNTSTWSNDQYASCTLGAMSASNDYAGLLVRGDQSGNGIIFFSDTGTGSSHTGIGYYVSGSFTNYNATFSGLPSNDYKAKVEVSGTSPNLTVTVSFDSGSGF